MCDALRCAMLFVKVCSCLLLTLPFAAVQGQSKDFPYQARVVDDELFVRSGAGDAWHPTQRLTRDTIVTVHRHDPGGWYMIEPPEGSFSWIPQRFVKQLSATDGEVTENNVVAFVGSEFGDDTTVWQRRLMSGEKVRILGQQELLTLSGRQAMYRIAPPRREFRWIPGSGVVPVDEQRRRQMDHDPYATPSNAVRPKPRSATGGGVTDVPPVNPNSQVARLQRIQAEQKRLAEIDQRFRDMILQDPSAWNLESVEADYRQLQKETSYRPLAGQIDLRYPAIERYRRRHAEYLDFRNLTSQTEMRDAELVARTGTQFGHPAPLTPLGSLSSAPQTSAVAAFGPVASAGPESVVIAGQAPSVAEAFAAFASNQQVTPPNSLTVSSGPEPAAAPPVVVGPGAGQQWEFVGGAATDPTAVAVSASEVSAADDPALSFAESGGLAVPDAAEMDAAASGLPSLADLSGGTIEMDTASAALAGMSELAGATEAGAAPFNAGMQNAAGAPGETESPRNRYVGAGIIQRAAATGGGSGYVLQTPSGRVLAHLKPAQSVNLEPYVGQQVGLHGSRAFQDALQSDLIEVSGLEPVRIRQ